MKRSLLLFVLLFTALFSFGANNTRSDTIDITDENISLNITDFTGKTISGFCTVTFKSKLDNIGELDLDLLKLSVDSITQNDHSLSFSYNDSVTLKISLVASMNTGDSSQVTVYYHGIPQIDPSQLGGFAYSGTYAFNIGVGFIVDPHPFGRCWFPCFDNFVERSTYHFSIITTSDKMAVCNGEFISGIDNGDGTTTWSWKMDQTIPSYLACVDVGPFKPIHQTYIGIQDTIPILLSCTPADSVRTVKSFAHLDSALSIFEHHFGYYRWNKVGYSMVPSFYGGIALGLEHATNIAYPSVLVNGTLAYEDVIAHELSHHWFGDLVTCRTEQDMWLNEGWATYCERIYQEYLYGEEAYKKAIAVNHESTLHYAHTSLEDGSYFALNSIPHLYTYGNTVYDKGSDVAHTLRAYMGDSLFFHCLTNYVNAFEYKDASSEDFRDFLSSCSGIDLTDFFTDWVFNPGRAAFTIDSSEVSKDGTNFQVNVFIRERPDHAPLFYNNVPLEISFYDSAWNVTKQMYFMSGSCGIYSTSLSFSPLYVGLNLAEKISDAVTADLKTIKATGIIALTNGKMTVNVSSITDSALVRIEHVYAPPDAFKNTIPHLHISQERFWKVDGIFPSGFDASGTISYNGTTFTGGFLDNQLISNVEDSLVVLHRSSSASDWKIDSDVIQNVQGLHADKRGAFTINHLQKGEYTFAIFQQNKIDSVFITGMDSCMLLSVPPILSGEKEIMNVFPIPASDAITIQFDHASFNNLLEIFNLYGVRVYQSKFNGTQKMITVRNWSRGIYFVKISDEHRIIATQKIVIN